MLIGLMGAAIRSRSPVIIPPTGIVWAPGAPNITYSDGGLTITKSAGASAYQSDDHTGNKYGGSNVKLAVAVKATQVGGGDVAWGFRNGTNTLGFNGAAWYLNGDYNQPGYPGYTKDGSQWHLIFVDISGGGATKKFYSWYGGYGWADHTGDPNSGGGGLDISSSFSGDNLFRFFGNLYAAGDSITANFGGSAWPTTLPAGTIGFGN